MKVYVSGPISGYEEANLPAFRSAADFLVSMGHEPVVPHDIAPWEHAGDCPVAYTHGIDHTAACYLRGDLVALLQCEAIYMIGRWEASVGAMLEHHVAAFCGIPIYYQGSGLLAPEVKPRG